MGRGRINCEAIGLTLLTETVENSATRVFHSETATRGTPHCSLVQALLCPCATVGFLKPPITCYYLNPSNMNREVNKRTLKFFIKEALETRIQQHAALRVQAHTVD